MPKKAAAKPKLKAAPFLGPQHVTYIKVPASLGEGRVSLYDSKAGVPNVVNIDELKSELKTSGRRWILVHFPSRHWVLVKTEAIGRRDLKEISKGKNLHKLLPEKPVSKRVSKGRACAAARASSSTGPSEGSTANGATKSAEKNPEHKEQVTPVPEGANFDQAMTHVFPVQRLTANFERLLAAEEEVRDREGKLIGTRPNYPVQFQTLKALTEWRQGRPGEKEKPPAEKPKMSYEELVAWITHDEAALEHMESLCARARSKPKAKPAPQPALTPS